MKWTHAKNTTPSCDYMSKGWQWGKMGLKDPTWLSLPSPRPAARDGKNFVTLSLPRTTLITIF